MFRNAPNESCGSVLWCQDFSHIYDWLIENTSKSRVTSLLFKYNLDKISKLEASETPTLVTMIRALLSIDHSRSIKSHLFLMMKKAGAFLSCKTHANLNVFVSEIRSLLTAWLLVMRSMVRLEDYAHGLRIKTQNTKQNKNEVRNVDMTLLRTFGGFVTLICNLRTKCPTLWCSQPNTLILKLQYHHTVFTCDESPISIPTAKH